MCSRILTFLIKYRDISVKELCELIENQIRRSINLYMYK